MGLILVTACSKDEVTDLRSSSEVIYEKARLLCLDDDKKIRLIMCDEVLEKMVLFNLYHELGQTEFGFHVFDAGCHL